MTEKEKRDNQMLYFSEDTVLVKEREQAKQLCFRYNHLPPEAIQEKEQMIKKLLKKTGQYFTIEPDFWCDYGYNITIGENFYMNHHGIILDVASVTFGKNVFIGPNCGFYTAGHPLNPKQREQYLEYGKPISIGNDVWIGGNCVILPGVKIGDGVTIGAGSVVTKDIPSNVLAYGYPCKVIREL